MKRKLLQMSAVLLSALMISNSTACTKKKYEDILLEETDETKEYHIKLNQEIDSEIFLHQLATIPIDYNDSTYYLDRLDLLAIFLQLESFQKCDYENVYDLKSVYQSILENSGLVKIESEQEKILVSSIEMALCNCYLNVSDNGDDFCKLKDLKIQIDQLEQGVFGRYYNSNNLIVVDYEQNAKESNRQKEASIEEVLAQSLEHELNHARQYICSCRKKKGQLNYNLGYAPKNIFDSIIEATAESFQYNLDVNILKEPVKSTYEYHYYNERNTQTILLLMGMFKDNFTMNTYYQSVFNSDLNKLFNLYDLNNEQAILDFYQVVYAIDAINGRNDLSSDLRAKGNGSRSKLKEVIGVDYKIVVFKTATSDLIKRIVSDDLKLEDSLKLYNFVKSHLLSLECELKEVEGQVIMLHEEELIEKFALIDAIFYQFLCQKFMVSESEIENILNSSSFTEHMNYLTGYLDMYQEFSQEIQEKNNILIQKFPVMSEINYCDQISYQAVKDFEYAKEKGWKKERILP